MNGTSHACLATLAAVTTLLGCADGMPDGTDDAEDASFLSGDKADAFGISSTSYEAAAILEVASTATAAELKAIGVGTRAANTTVAAVRPFPTLRALDDVTYTGEIYFTRLLDHVEARGLVGRCGDARVQPTTGERCDGGPGCSATCQPAEDFDTSMIAARIALPATVGWPYSLTTLPGGQGYLLVGTSTATTAAPLVLGTRTLPRGGMFLATIDNTGAVTALRSVTTAGQPLPDGPTVVQTWGPRTQLQHRTDAYELDLATGAATRVSGVPANYTLLRTLDSGDVLAMINGDVNLLDVTSLEPVWRIPCTKSFDKHLTALTDSALWCGAGFTVPSVRRFGLTGDLEAAPPVSTQIPRSTAAIAGADDGVWVIDSGRLEKFSAAGTPVTSIGFATGSGAGLVSVTQKSVDIDAAGGQAISIIQANYAGERFGRPENTYQRQLVFSRSSTATLRLAYFSDNGGLPVVRSTPTSIAVLDRPRFLAAQPATTPRTILIVPRSL